MRKIKELKPFLSLISLAIPFVVILKPRFLENKVFLILYFLISIALIFLHFKENINMRNPIVYLVYAVIAISVYFLLLN